MSQQAMSPTPPPLAVDACPCDRWVSAGGPRGGEHFREGARVGEIAEESKRRHFSQPVEIGRPRKTSGRRPGARRPCARIARKADKKPRAGAHGFGIEGMCLSARSSVTRAMPVHRSQAEPGRGAHVASDHFDRKGSRFAAADAERGDAALEPACLDACTRVVVILAPVAPIGMPRRTGAAIYVEARVVDAMSFIAANR